MKKANWKTFDQALVNIRTKAGYMPTGKIIEKDKAQPVQLGTDFEKLMVEYFKRDSIYGLEFVDAKRWYDWYQEPDIGIDIVAKDVNDNIIGIQCKCWADDAVLDLKDVSTMFAAATAKKISRLMIVFTGDRITGHTQKGCDEAGVRIITRAELRASRFNWNTAAKKTKRKTLHLMAHQKEAVAKTLTKFREADRGQLIMACGTGKTLTSLHIAENMVGAGGLVLYLVPSISLIPQTMREWADNRSIPHKYVAVCSDKTSGSDEEGSITEIPVIPSTNVKMLQSEYKSMNRKDVMYVIFSTYNSVAVASKALLEHDKNASFDLILFDEAHKTTGVEKVKESFYLMAHNNPEQGKAGVPAKKRLYMTATPRVYKRTTVKKKGRNKSATPETELKVYSMDNAAVYGDEFYKLEFSEAVDRGLLSEYKIIMREVNQEDLYGKFIESGQDPGRSDKNDYGDIDMHTLAKMGGICKAVTYPDGENKLPRPLQRVMVFHDRVKKSSVFAGHDLGQDRGKKPLKLDKTTKKALSFDTVSKRLIDTDPNLSSCTTHTRHVDGQTNSRNRGMRIDWLRSSDMEPDEIRILSNARCLQEGVDVPALDAVAFMDPKRSPIDIIQSIGRVMRKPDKSKKYGYVIVPIPVLEGDNPRYALDRNKKYEQINEILQAILAHDNRLRSILNNQMLVRSSPSPKRKPMDQQELTPQLRAWIEQTIEGGISDELLEDIKTVLLELGDKSFYKRVGEELGEQSVIIEIMLKQIIKHKSKTAKIIDTLHKNLQAVVGTTITMQDTIKVLAQHAVMNRVFVELFPGHKNPIASAFDNVLEKIRIHDQLKKLEKYYLKIKYDIEQFDTPDAKQEFIRTIYDAFFRGADRKAADKHGIVYTPIEIVDFISNSVQYVLKKEFGKSFNDRCVKVLEPFAGTGIFISQLLESGAISSNNIYAKFKNDIYANEIMLPAYYVAMANIEASYQKVKNKNNAKYVPFENISLMDTFDQHPLYRLDVKYRQKQIQITDANLEEAQTRKRRQGMEIINVIMTNPPYSGGQKTANEDNKNLSHPELEKRIESTYIRNAPKGNVRGLYNSYIKAFRWASDRIEDSGIIGIITPSAYITGISEAGIRACLKDEFTDVYCFDLLSQKGAPGHGRSVFEYTGDTEGGTTVGVAITILVKNPNKQRHDIHYYKLPETEYSGEQKRQYIKKLKSIENIDWQKIIPDAYNDWRNQRGPKRKSWERLVKLGKKNNENNTTIFRKYYRGLASSRDAWVYNSSLNKLIKNIQIHIKYSNSQDLDNFKINPKKSKKNSSMIERMKKSGKIVFDKNQVRTALYRPFFRQFLYFDSILIHEVDQISKFFPDENIKNPTLLMPDKAGTFSTIVTDSTPDLNNIAPNQSFPLRTKADKDTHTHTHTHTHSNSNLFILIPNKIKGEFSTFITNLTPDLEVVHHGQVFPMRIAE